MRTYELILNEFSTYWTFDERNLYLRSLTIPELNLFKENITKDSFPLIVSMIDAILLERLPEIREDKLNQILYIKENMEN